MIGGALAVVPWLCALGCWRGWIPVLVFSSALGALMLFVGLAMVSSTNFLIRVASQSYGLIYFALGAAIVGCLLVPRSSRDWFFQPH
jgi:hypothetical protein